MPEQFEDGRNFDGKSIVVDFDAIEIYLNPKNRQVSFQKRQEMFCFHHSRVFTRCCFQKCRLGFRFQNLPFSKSAGKKCAGFV